MNERRRRGRPRVGDRVTVRIPDDLLDDICREAIQEGEDVSTIIRRRCEAFRSATEAAATALESAAASPFCCATGARTPRRRESTSP